MTVPLPAVAQEVHTFNVPAADPASAIRAFGAQAGIQILASADDLKGKQLNPVNGEISTENGLNDLLAGTGLVHRYVGDRAVALTNDDGASGSAGLTTNTPIPGGRSVRLAQEGPTPTNTAHPGEHARDPAVAASDSGNLALEEIVVTAQKRSERLQDVPLSLTALSGDALENSKSTRLEDFVGKVPGLTLIDDGALGSQVVIRGITTGVLAINSSVATYIDETPYTVEGAAGGSYVMAPNLDTFDMQRIEVLRGPQGTLYGSNALGGILKYVTNAPDPTGFQARVESGVSSVTHGAVGFDTHGMVNLPLTEDAALRIVGYDNYYPGFIDDPARGLTDINGSRFVGTRASLLYTPVSNLSIRLNALYQDRSWNDFSNEDVTSGSLTPVYGSLGQEELNRQPGHVVSQLYNLTVNFDAGFANLLSTTSYYNYKPHALYDQSTLDHTVSGILGGSYGVAVQYADPVQAVTQEVRLSSSGTQPLQWLVGGYFTNESTGEIENLYPVNAATYSVLYGYPVDLARVNLPSSYREYAGFANLDYFITPAFDVAAGGRYSENKQQLHEGEQGLLTGVIDINTPSSQGVFTYSGDVRWHLTPKTMLYARVAEGFVPGGPNNVIATAPVPKEYSSSTTMNYETGIKTSLLDGRFTAEVSAFLVDWRDIQLSALVGGINTTTNGGTARSDGVEWDFAYKPVSELTLGFNGAYTDARLTEATPASVGGQVGNRLPAVPLWETSTDAEYERPLFGNYSGFMALDWRFMGARYADFVAAGTRQKMPSFNIVDWRTGIGTKKWSVSLYVKNIADKIAINYVRAEALPGGAAAQSAVVYTPRTVGLSVTANF